MPWPRKLLLATRNQGKIRELMTLLEDNNFRVTTPMTEGISISVQETGSSYEENASMKARAFALASGLVALADDSGLEVDALAGAPGPLSARFAGPGASDDQNLDLLLEKLTGVPWERRAALFVCVIAVASPGGRLEVCRGSCKGIIASDRAGASGFGYDPVFYLPDLGVTMAQLDMERKNRVSHRARAVHEAVPIIARLLEDPGGQ